MRLFAFGLIALSSLAPAQAGAPLPTWMAGHWLSCAGGEQVVENWIAGETILVGTNVTRGKTRESFEFLRVGANGKDGLAYFSMPDGAPVTAFNMVLHEGQRAVFENKGHDFPQRILYRREGDVLHARIEGDVNGKVEGVEWTFSAARIGQGCKR